MNNLNIKKNIFLSLIIVLSFFIFNTQSVSSQSLGPVVDNKDKLIVENPPGKAGTSPFTYSSCEDGSVLVGFNIYNAGGKYTKVGSLYCKSISFGLGSVTAITKNVIESPWGGAGTPPFTESSCPDGSVLVGFNIHNAGGNISKTASLYCKPLPTSIRKVGSVVSYISPVIESPNWLTLPANEEQISSSSCPNGSVLVGFNLLNMGENYSFVGALYCQQITLPVFNYSLSATDISSLRPNKTGSGVVTATLGEGTSVNSTYHGNCYASPMTGEPKEVICTSNYPELKRRTETYLTNIKDSGDRFAREVCGADNHTWGVDPRGITTFTCSRPITTVVNPITQPVSLTLARINDAKGNDVLGKKDGRGIQLVSLSPTSVTPTAISNITLKADANVPEGVYTAIVVGNPGSTKPGGAFLDYQIDYLAADKTKSITYAVCTEYKDLTAVKTTISSAKGYPIDYVSTYTSSGCKTLSPRYTETLKDALQIDSDYLGGYSFYNDKYTRDKLCSVLFPDAPINTLFGKGGYGTPGDNGSVYWDEKEGAFVAVNASYRMTGNYVMEPNNVIDGQLFRCSNKPDDSEIVNTVATFKITVLSDRYDFKITSSGNQCNSSDLKLTATWDVVPGSTGYNLYRKTKDSLIFDKMNKSLIIPLSSDKKVTYDDKTGMSGIIYGYRVVAVVDGKEQEPSKIIYEVYPTQKDKDSNECNSTPLTDKVPTDESQPVIPPPKTGNVCPPNCGEDGTTTSVKPYLYIEARETNLNNVVSQKKEDTITTSYIGETPVGGIIPTLKIKAGKTFTLTASVGPKSGYSSCTLSNKDNYPIWTAGANEKLNSESTKGYSAVVTNQVSSVVFYTARCLTRANNVADTVSVNVQIIDSTIKER